METMSFFTTKALPISDGMFKQIRRSHMLRTKFQRKLILKLSERYSVATIANDFKKLAYY